ncbi:unnamed protein product [Phytophthora fragariaefolia]|uniref:Unnamed protein product n=1 Tax=Phytophthora fragariaefolia TaxID=1490495 RepID=A0A9W6YBX0_9STRA|nr:unnamed protein product [Phytophthora fragariaefolia]
MIVLRAFAFICSSLWTLRLWGDVSALLVSSSPIEGITRSHDGGGGLTPARYEFQGSPSFGSPYADEESAAESIRGNAASEVDAD